MSLPRPGTNPSPVPFFEQPTSPTRRFHRGPAHELLNVSNDAEDYVNQPQIRSVPSRPAIYYGEGPFSPPSSDDEDDYAKEVDNDPNWKRRRRGRTACRRSQTPCPLAISQQPASDLTYSRSSINLWLFNIF